MSVSYFTKFRAKAGKGEELCSFLSRVASSMDGYPSCGEYRVFSVSGQPDAVCVFETWSDAEAHDASLKDPAVREKVMEGMTLIEQVERQDVLEG